MLCSEVIAQTVTNLSELLPPFSQHLNSPGPLAADSQGNVYTFDSGSRSGFKVSPGGVVNQVIDFERVDNGNTDTGVVPRGVAVDSEDNAYFLGGNTISRYSPEGELISVNYVNSLGISFTGAFLVIDPLDDIYLIRQQFSRDGPDMAKFSGDDAYGEFNIYDTEELASYFVNDVIAAPDGGIYVAAGDSVFRVQPSGGVSAVFTPADYAGLTAGEPWRLAVDEEGQLYVAVMSTLFRIPLGGESTVLAEASHRIAALAVSETGTVYAMEYTDTSLIGPTIGDHVLALAPDGGTSNLYPLQATEKLDSVLLHEGYFLVDDDNVLFSFGRLGIGAIDSDNVINLLTGVLPQMDFGSVNDMTVDYQGNIYYSSANQASATRLAPDGYREEIITEYADNLNSFTASGSISVDLAGNVYVAGEESNNVFRADMVGNVQQLIGADGDGESSLLFPSAIAVSPADQSVYVAGRNSNNVFRIDNEGLITELIDATGDGTAPLLEPVALTVDHDGILYVAGHGSDNVFAIEQDGTITQVINTNGDGVNSLLGPRGSVAAADGTVYVTGEDSNNLFALHPGGEIEQILDSSGDGNHPLLQPNAVAVDAFGNVFVSAFESHNAFAVTTAGDVIMFFDVHDYAEEPRELARIEDIAVDARGTIILKSYAGEVFENPSLYQVRYPEQISTVFNPHTNRLITAVSSNADGLIDVNFRYLGPLTSAPLFEFESYRPEMQQLVEMAEYDDSTGTLTIPALNVIGDRIYHDAVFQRTTPDSLVFRLQQISE